MRRNITLLFTILLTMTMCTGKTIEGQKLVIETSEGNIKIVLYDDTPIHQENFIKLVQEGYYEGLTFHRVIKEFMIQAGDATTRGDSSNVEFDEERTLAPEFRMPQHYHKAGALAAARFGDDKNPGKRSSAFQFYIVSGKTIYDHDIQKLEKERLEKLRQEILKTHQADSLQTIKEMYRNGDKEGIATLRTNNIEKTEAEVEARKSETLFTNEQKEVYKSKGGAPHLDGNYTVFGEVYEGLDIVKKIERTETNPSDRPLEAISIKKISLIK